MTAALLCGTFTTLSSGQQTAASGSGTGGGYPRSSAPQQRMQLWLKSTPPLTEDALRARYVGKLIFLRGSYLGDDLQVRHGRQGKRLAHRRLLHPFRVRGQESEAFQAQAGN